MCRMKLICLNNFKLNSIIFQFLVLKSLLIVSVSSSSSSSSQNDTLRGCENCILEDTIEETIIKNSSSSLATNNNINNKTKIMIRNNINNNDDNCTIIEEKMMIICQNGLNNSINSSENFQIHEIVFHNWRRKTFDPLLILKYFPYIRILRIENSKNLTHISNGFPYINYIENINISWTNLAYIHPTLFQHLHKLKYLDLRWNQLNHIESPLIFSRNFEKLYLASNPWNCTKNLKWLLNSEKAKYVIDRDLLTCNDTKYFGRNLLTVMNYKMVLKEECQNHEEIRNCSCSMHYIRRSDDGKYLIPIYAINCSYLNLYNFPSYLPDNATIFYATNNKISDVRSLRNNAVYRSVIDVYLDYNQIQSIDVLEAGYWLRNFRVLSLKGNKLTQLPVYALDNAFENNQQVARLYLSMNPWLCDCKFIMKFRELLMKYHTIITDSNDVKCKLYDYKLNKYIDKNVLSIQRNDICKLIDETNIQPIEILNIILVILICFVFIKLGYDYYNYRKYGRLPWIITKLP